MKDDLGDRIKSQYEDRTRYFLPRRTYTIIRLDGRSFHTYCKDCEKPYDKKFMEAMDHTTLSLCNGIQGSVFGFVQSDEISILLTDFTKITTDAWFDGNIQKIASVAASIATAAFNKYRGNQSEATFDSRVFTIPDPTEVKNYFIWRQKDASRNSVQMLAQSLYSHKELHCKSISEQHELIHAKGMNWNDSPTGTKRGRVVKYYTDSWKIEEPPEFTKYKQYLNELVPNY